MMRSMMRSHAWPTAVLALLAGFAVASTGACVRPRTLRLAPPGHPCCPHCRRFFVLRRQHHRPGSEHTVVRAFIAGGVWGSRVETSRECVPVLQRAAQPSRMQCSPFVHLGWSVPRPLPPVAPPCIVSVCSRRFPRLCFPCVRARVPQCPTSALVTLRCPLGAWPATRSLSCCQWGRPLPSASACSVTRTCSQGTLGTTLCPIRCTMRPRSSHSTPNRSSEGPCVCVLFRVLGFCLLSLTDCVCWRLPLRHRFVSPFPVSPRSAFTVVTLGSVTSLTVNTFPVPTTSTVILCQYLDPVQVNTVNGGTVPNPTYNQYIAANPLTVGANLPVCAWSSFEPWRLSAYVCVCARPRAVNTGPSVNVSVLPQAAIPTLPFSFTLPPHTFADPDPGDTLTCVAAVPRVGVSPDGSTYGYSAALPQWLSLTGMTFSGTPANTDAEDITVVLTCADIFGATVVTSFDLHIWSERPGIAVCLGGV